NCPPSWYEIKSSETCIKVFVEKLNWHDARNVCKSVGGDLARVTWVKMRGHLQRQLDRSGSKIAWIGMHDKGLDSEQKPRHTDLISRQPATYGPNRMCPEFRAKAHKKAARGRCLHRKSFVCEFAPGCSSLSCEPGYIKATSSRTCVKPFNELKAWTDARTVCKKDGGDLVKILDQHANTFVQGR
ncbi:macrophage mannose receptor 1, partial [Elysia marginata]